MSIKDKEELEFNFYTFIKLRFGSSSLGEKQLPMGDGMGGGL